MCFSFEVSLGTGLICWIVAACVAIIQPAMREEALFLAMFSSMQFADAALWWNGMQPNRTNWFITSLIIPSILSLQVLFNASVHYRHSGQTILFLPALLWSVYTFVRLHGVSSRACGSLGSPVWGGKEFTAVEFAIFSTLIVYPNWSMLFVTWAVLFGISRVVCGGYGSMWCALSCLLVLRTIYRYYCARPNTHDRP